MSLELILLFVATAAFVGGHFALSHGLRRSAVAMFGTGGFSGVYSLVSIVLLVLTLIAYHFAPRTVTLWPVGSPVLAVLASALTYVAIVLFLGSVVGNPALIGANVNGLSTVLPHGTFLVTRHPMMFAIAMISLAHILYLPSPRNLVFLGGMIVLAIYGSHMQDRRKIAASGSEWRAWVTRTPFWPDWRKLPAMGYGWIYALPIWLAITWSHLRFLQIPAGIWAFFPDAAG